MARGSMSGWLLGAAFAALACMSPAEGAPSAPLKIEADMLVTGRITIEHDGTASGWTLDRRDSLPREVIELIDESLPSWRFEPVLIDGQPVRGSASMRLSLHARPLPDGSHGAVIADARFGLAARPPRVDAKEREAGIGHDSSSLRAIDMTPSHYPPQAVQGGHTGTLHVAVRVGRTGQVEDVVVEQVNLRKRASSREMRQARSLFEQAAVSAARQWTFQVPTIGERAALPYWTLRTVVRYSLNNIDHDPADPRNYGKWQAYYAGPKTPIPWEVDAAEAGIPYALQPGDIHVAGTGLRLLTPLDGG